MTCYLLPWRPRAASHGLACVLVQRQEQSIPEGYKSQTASIVSPRYSQAGRCHHDTYMSGWGRRTVAWPALPSPCYDQPELPQSHHGEAC